MLIAAQEALRYGRSVPTFICRTTLLFVQSTQLDMVLHEAEIQVIDGADALP